MKSALDGNDSNCGANQQPRYEPCAAKNYDPARVPHSVHYAVVLFPVPQLGELLSCRSPRSKLAARRKFAVSARLGLGALAD